MKRNRVAVIFTCFNRAENTKCCLCAIEKESIRLSETFEVVLYVCDDGSTDNTQNILKSSPLNVHIINGGGLYWSKGMYVAMKAAVKDSYDYYLMINDDVDFFDGFLEVMIASHRRVGVSCGIVGSMRSKKRNITTYGGKKYYGIDFINPEAGLIKCDLANWNSFLIDDNVVVDTGLIDHKYAHSYGDYDYCMKMHRNGFDIYIADRYVGICDRNRIEGTFQDSSISRKRRIELLNSPKGLPIRSGIRYSIKNRDFLGYKYLFIFLGAYVKNYFKIIMGK